MNYFPLSAKKQKQFVFIILPSPDDVSQFRCTYATVSCCADPAGKLPKIEGRQKLAQFWFYLEAYAVYYLRKQRATLVFNRHWFSARCHQIQWALSPPDKTRSPLTGSLNSAGLLIYDLDGLSAVINFSSPSTNPVIDKEPPLLWDWKN